MSDSAFAILNAPKQYEQKAYDKFINDSSITLLSEFVKILNNDMDAKGYEEITNKFLETKGLKLKDIAQALRVSLVGSSVSPSIFDVLEIIGVSQAKERILNLINKEAK